jgi:hypothetical protein
MSSVGRRKADPPALLPIPKGVDLRRTCVVDELNADLHILDRIPIG